MLKSAFKNRSSSPNSDRSPIQAIKPSDFGGRSTRDNDINGSYMSVAAEHSFGAFNPPEEEDVRVSSSTDNMLLGMQEDLKIMRIRRAGMVDQLKQRIQNIEGELNQSSII